MPETISGLLVLSFEQGSEGRGCWSFQDERYIRKNIGRGYCRKCRKDLRPQKDQPHPEQLPLTGVLYCLPDEHEEEIGDQLDYKGLYSLEDGDHLTVYDKENPSEIVWSGTVKIGINYVTSTQEDVEQERWTEWFAKNYPAALIPKHPKRVV